MVKGKSLIDWDRAGAELARESSDEQIEFFKSFSKECRAWGTFLQIEQQLCFVNRALTKDEQETLRMLGYDNDNS